MKKDGFFVTLNHPVRSNSTTEEFSVIRGYDAVEICNPIAVTFNNFSDDSPLYENDLRAGGRAAPVAADNCHKIFEEGSPFCEYYKSFTVVKATELTYDSIVNALTAGNFYASTGPRFENLLPEGDLLHVECSPVYGVFVHSKYPDVKTQDVQKTDCITHTVLNDTI